MSRPVVHLLDYGAGNVRSIRNAIRAAGFDVEDLRSASDLDVPGLVRVLVFPGVGAFGCAMRFLDEGGYRGPLVRYLSSGRPYMGMCLGMQTLFESSEESPGVAGLGVIPGAVTRFESSASYSVPHMGWNAAVPSAPHHPALAGVRADARVYFVHSYRALPTPENAPWVLTRTHYGGGDFISAVAKGALFATQFHPEKSGQLGVDMFKNFLSHCFRSAADGAGAGAGAPSAADAAAAAEMMATAARMRVARRIVACLDVRTNDEGDLVVTKGDKYDVREKESPPEGDASAAAASAAASSPSSAAAGALAAASRPVRNLGKPVDLCARYYDEGADEIAFLNITAFRGEPLEDSPMLAVLEAASARVFVPLTIGGGIRSYTDGSGKSYSALDVAARYFRAGADKVSIGSDAVAAAEDFYARGSVCDGSSAIEAIATVYGRQAVVVSVDPKRVYVASPEDAEVKAAGHVLLRTKVPGPGGETWAWYQCLVKGGREGRPICAQRLAMAVEALGAGELLVNCVDNDGQKGGFDEELLASMCAAVRIPVIASSGAGAAEHFSSVFNNTRVEAALAAGIFHRREVAIEDVKKHLVAVGIDVRMQA